MAKSAAPSTTIETCEEFEIPIDPFDVDEECVYVSLRNLKALQPALSSAAVGVFTELASFVGTLGMPVAPATYQMVVVCQPWRDAFCSNLGISQATFSNAVNELVERDVIKYVHRGVYSFNEKYAYFNSSHRKMKTVDC